jgi:dihydropteroate synthase
MIKDYTINCKGNLINLNVPKVMGILNVTPDSFFDGGQNNSIQTALKQTEKMLSEGADFIDIGGMSSRPGAEIITLEEERQRVIPVLEAILKEFPNTLVSIDTFRVDIANETIQKGASIINDISGGDQDLKMFETIAKLRCPYILMHMRGTAETMQSKTEYDNVTIEVIQELSAKIEKLKRLNVKDIIIDPGFGFSKTIAQNYQLLNELEMMNQIIDLPILAGVSRKSMIWKLLNISPKEALNATSALNLQALQNGSKILRVHDVKEAKEIVQLYLVLNN